MLKILFCFFCISKIRALIFSLRAPIFYKTEVSKQHPKLGPDFSKSAPILVVSKTPILSHTTTKANGNVSRRISFRLTQHFSINNTIAILFLNLQIYRMAKWVGLVGLARLNRHF